MKFDLQVMKLLRPPREGGSPIEAGLARRRLEELVYSICFVWVRENNID